MNKYEFVLFDAQNNVILTASEYGNNRGEALQTLMNGNIAPKDKARIHQIEIFDLKD